MALELSLYLLISTIITVLLVRALIQRRNRHEKHVGPWLSELPQGPTPSSWMAGVLGSLPDLMMKGDVGDADENHVKKYGLTFKMKSVFGSDMLYLGDPQGMHYVLDTCAYTFHKEDSAKVIRMIFGKNILSSEGPDHARQRKVVAPGFYHAIIKDLVPIFAQVAERLTRKWSDILQDGNFAVVDVHSWISKVTLDAIGQGVFSYDFGAMTESPSEFVEVYQNLFVEMFSKRSNMEMVMGELIPRLPFWMMGLFRNLAFRFGSRFNKFQIISQRIAEEIVHNEMKAAEGQVPQGKDLMSSLVRANMAQDPKEKMTEEELLSQTMVLTIAGHETTASALAWVLYELARHPKAQSKLREEIKAFRAQIGGRELEASDFDLSLPYTTAVIKETLRFYPIGSHNTRRAGKDETIPLSYSIKTASGRTTNSVSIKKGQEVIMSFWAYNRIKALWGEDAEEWNPERFFSDKMENRHTLGVYANLATFGSGVHSCIGWRFAVLELHTILVTLIEKFEFRPPLEGINIVRVAIATLLPMVQGDEDRGGQLPLNIKVL